MTDLLPWIKYPKRLSNLSRCILAINKWRYDVTFTNGDVVEFNKRGEWKNIDCKYSAVPDGVIPTAIQSYVAKNYPNAKVKQLERDRKDYDVELTNGWEIKFDKRFRVIELDR